MCLSRDASATLALVNKLVERGWSRRAAWEKAESWQRMTIWSERRRRAELERDASFVEMHDPPRSLDGHVARTGKRE